ncbi:hypothetical protein C8Q79DRAFT_994379 [Trametes meyenii]|nr:hypothetical protein C8Q79DRAFT_994379 [Trametes meyenii]
MANIIAGNIFCFMFRRISTIILLSLTFHMLFKFQSSVHSAWWHISGLLRRASVDNH